MVIEEEANIAAADRKKTCAIINPLIPSKNGAAKQDNIIVVKATKITTPDFFTRSSKNLPQSQKESQTTQIILSKS